MAPTWRRYFLALALDMSLLGPEPNPRVRATDQLHVKHEEFQINLSLCTE